MLAKVKHKAAGIAAIGAAHQPVEFVSPGFLGDAQEDLVIQLFKGAAGNKQHMLGIDRLYLGMPAAVFEIGHFNLYMLVLHQGKQAVLGDNPLYIRFAAHHGADLVHFVDTDNAVGDILPHGFQVRVLTQDVGGLTREPVHHDIALLAAARQVGHQVGVDPDDGGKLFMAPGLREESLDGSHDGGLACARVANHEHVTGRVLDQVLVDGNGHILQGLVLPDYILVQGVIYLSGCQ
jgi:hypothetical protein